MTPEETAHAVRAPFLKLGAGFMLSRATSAKGKEAGYRALTFYFGGRGGVLGPAAPEVVQAVFGFFPPDRVRERWLDALRVGPPAAATALYAEACHEWGRKRLAGADGLDRLAALVERVADAADPAGLPLFAGWRALPLPDDGPARVAQLCMVMREHRGGLHLAAVVAAGLAPLPAVMASYGTREGGESMAQFLGWQPPYPDGTPHVAAWAAAEQATDRVAATPYAVLDEPERDELVTLLGQARAAAFR